MFISTSRVSRGVLAVALAATLWAGPGAAMSFCIYDRYSGEARMRSIMESWLGTGFQLDLEKALVRRVYGDKATDWFPVEVRKRDRFVTVSYREYAKVEGGGQYGVVWSFRVRENGACEGVVQFSLSGQSLIGKGTVER